MNKEGLDTVKNFFTQGALRQKQDEALSIIESGYSAFFEGEVSWQMHLIEEDKIFSGHSESLDDAMSVMSNHMLFLMQEMSNDAQISFLLREDK